METEHKRRLECGDKMERTKKARGLKHCAVNAKRLKKLQQRCCGP
jgi:hypothetical protein